MKPRRLALWLLCFDVCSWLNWQRGMLFCVRRASDCTDWGEGATLGEGEPF